jgi:hypothetical protein
MRVGNWVLFSTFSVTMSRCTGPNETSIDTISRNRTPSLPFDQLWVPLTIAWWAMNNEPCWSRVGRDVNGWNVSGILTVFCLIMSGNLSRICCTMSASMLFPTANCFGRVSHDHVRRAMRCLPQRRSLGIRRRSSHVVFHELSGGLGCIVCSFVKQIRGTSGA